MKLRAASRRRRPRNPSMSLLLLLTCRDLELGQVCTAACVAGVLASLCSQGESVGARGCELDGGVREVIGVGKVEVTVTAAGKGGNSCGQGPDGSTMG